MRQISRRRIAPQLLGLSLAWLLLGPLNGEANAHASGEIPRMYPVFAYGKFWGIAEVLHVDKEVEIDVPGLGKVQGIGRELTGVGNALKRLGIPIPLSIDEVLNNLPPEEKEKLSKLRAALAHHYGPTLRLGDDFKFRQMLRPAKFLKARFGHNLLSVQVVTTKESFVTTITKVLVQEADYIGCEKDQVVLYAFDASGCEGEPLFAIPVSRKKSRPAKVYFRGKTPLRPPKEGSPHAYVLTAEGFQGKITLEVIQWLGRWENWEVPCPQDAPEERCVRTKKYRLAVKDTKEQATFSQDFWHPESDMTSELYLSPPLLFSGSPLPFFVLYSTRSKHDWYYARDVYQLVPGGKLKTIASQRIDIRGVSCL